MAYLENYQLWLIAGAVIILCEVLLTGVGFLFLGLAAITTGVLIVTDIISQDNYVFQFTACFIITAFWAGVLWKPLKKFTLSSDKTGYDNIIGSTAIVISRDLCPIVGGNVRWSGTTMKALLEDVGEVAIPEGTVVKIIDIRNNILVVKEIKGESEC